MLNVGLKVVPVLLLLLSEPSEEVGVVLSPSLSLALKEAFLPPLVVVRVHKLAGGELLHFVERAVEPADCLFDVPPGLVEISAVGRRQVDAVVCQLAVHLSVGFVHRVQFFMGFLKFLQLVGGVDYEDWQKNET